MKNIAHVPVYVGSVNDVQYLSKWEILDEEKFFFPSNLNSSMPILNHALKLCITLRLGQIILK